MRFVWDDEKNRRNRAKHRISFDTAQFVFDDPYALWVKDQIVEGEQRWHTIGSAGGITVLVVVHTSPDETEPDVIRIISARRATAQERKRYEEND